MIINKIIEILLFYVKLFLFVLQFLLYIDFYLFIFSVNIIDFLLNDVSVLNIFYIVLLGYSRCMD